MADERTDFELAVAGEISTAEYVRRVKARARNWRRSFQEDRPDRRPNPPISREDQA